MNTRKRIAWMAGTMIPIYSMLTIFMPPGFAGVPWMLLVLFVFVGLFIALLVSEKSPLWNGLIAFCFWLPMVALHIAQPGTETVAKGEVYVLVVEILGIAAIHGLIQYVLRRLLN